ncbi:methyltransferase [Corallococcus coralloides DSM 2259]|uniref:Methyltransferase n=1 Tax=Corallococcus coralloides (strain ATCC 25202 / DSM 2259 / NBRC 100086 / M2) TaxID=1144275 RepID=H8MNT6_CORCM|nr:methyltransferase domain-containing protein [Corallococcus coralloides]AFE10696.1 methyltransferase [Corallococcus coralloides DSM 2259]
MQEHTVNRHVLDQALALTLLSWRMYVFEPARALRRLGLYRASTLGPPVQRGVLRGGGPHLSTRHAQPVLLANEPAGYEDVREFDRVASVYDTVVRPFSDPIVDEVLELMQPLPPNARILDPSAGPGGSALRLSRLVPEGEVVAADLSRGMVEAAHRAASAAGCRNMAFFQADVAQPPEAFTGAFDAVFCCLSFHHYPDGLAAARAFRQVLAPHGKVFVADGGPEWFVKLARPISELADPGFVRHRTGEEFLQLFTEAGFSSVSWVEALPGIGFTVATV